MMGHVGVSGGTFLVTGLHDGDRESCADCNGHVCSQYGYDHPLPPEDPAMLQGPEVGELMRYYYAPGRGRGRWQGIVVRVLRRSYVWSPGECRSRGGFRHYDWSVIQFGEHPDRIMVVNDSELTPLVLGAKVATEVAQEDR